MQNCLTFNVILDPKKSLVENLESELKDTEVMIDLFTSRHQSSDASFYEEKKAYLEKLIIDKHNDKMLDELLDSLVSAVQSMTLAAVASNNGEVTVNYGKIEAYRNRIKELVSNDR